MYFHHIIITTDLSDVSNQAIAYIVKRIPNEVEQITLLTVIAEWPLMIIPGEYIVDPKTIQEYNTNLYATRKEELDAVAQKYFPKEQVSTVVISSPSSAGIEICTYAAENKCDLIVIGSHGAGFLENLFIGSTVQKVLKNTPCPVLVIPNAQR